MIAAPAHSPCGACLWFAAGMALLKTISNSRRGKKPRQRWRGLGGSPHLSREAVHPSIDKRIRRSGPSQTSSRAIGSVGGPPANEVLSHREVNHPTRRHEHRAGQLVARADWAEDENPRQHRKYLRPGAERD